MALIDSQLRKFLAERLKFSVPPVLLAVAVLTVGDFPTFGIPTSQKDTVRTIVSDDFVRNRLTGKPRRKVSRNARKATGAQLSTGRSYRLASFSSDHGASTEFATELQVGLTFWKMRVPKVSGARFLMPSGNGSRWIAERVEADTEFHAGDYLRLSIESPHSGYLYVVDRDWFRNGDLGETSLIFPIRGDDNRLQAGKLIDIPAPNQMPFRATPKANQRGEILTIIITSSPLDLPISGTPLSISNAQLNEMHRMWGGATRRFEMENGAGQVRTTQEELAARKGTRQLTREDPPPQTIYVVTTKDRNALLFNVKLTYAP